MDFKGRYAWSRRLRRCGRISIAQILAQPFGCDTRVEFPTPKFKSGRASVTSVRSKRAIRGKGELTPSPPRRLRHADLKGEAMARSRIRAAENPKCGSRRRGGRGHDPNLFATAIVGGASCANRGQMLIDGEQSHSPEDPLPIPRPHDPVRLPPQKAPALHRRLSNNARMSSPSHMLECSFGPQRSYSSGGVFLRPLERKGHRRQKRGKPASARVLRIGVTTRPCPTTARPPRRSAASWDENQARIALGHP